MRLEEISKNIEKFNSKKYIKYIEASYEKVMKNVIRNNMDCYKDKEYAKEYIYG